jgi:hypothetical protein
MLGENGFADAGPVGDFVHAGGVEALLDEQTLRHTQDFRAPRCERFLVSRAGHRLSFSAASGSPPLTETDASSI